MIKQKQESSLLKNIESKLMKDQLIVDFYLFTKGTGAINIYFVSLSMIPVDHLRNILSELISPDLAINLIPCLSIPLKDSGAVDLEELGHLTEYPVNADSLLEKALYNAGAEHAVSAFCTKNSKPEYIHITDLYKQPDMSNLQSEDVSSNSNLFFESEQDALSIGEPLKEKQPYNCLQELFLKSCKVNSEKKLYILDGGLKELSFRYENLMIEVQKRALHLQKNGIEKGFFLIFQVSDLKEFIFHFWACIMLGAVPVPLAPATAYEKDNPVAKNILMTRTLLGKRHILVQKEWVEKLSNLLKNNDDTSDCLIPIPGETELNSSENFISEECKLKDTAVVLLTSGSTGQAKGVHLSHENILASIASTSIVTSLKEDDIILNWLPLDHPGPLIRTLIRPHFCGADTIQVATQEILKEPLLWLDLIEKYKATNVWAPNFAFNLLNSLQAEIKKKSPDLTSVRCMLNTAEPIVPTMVKELENALSPFGLKKGTMTSSWGMAETSSGVTQNCSYLEFQHSHEKQFANLGKPVPGVSLRIVDKDDNLLKEGQTGHVQVQGLQVTSGYYNNPKLNTNSFTKDNWFRTGDIGILQEGELFLTGRGKDVIIVSGKNIYSHEIESIVDGFPEVNRSYTAACGIPAMDNSEEIAIFINTDISSEPELKILLAGIRREVTKKIGAKPKWIIPVDADRIPKTSIGKIQRPKLKSSFIRGDFLKEQKYFDLLTESGDIIPHWYFKESWVQDNRPGDNFSTSDSSICICSGLQEEWSTRLDRSRIFSFADISGIEIPENKDLIILDLRQVSISKKLIDDTLSLISKIAALDESKKNLIIVSANAIPFRPDERADLNFSVIRGIAKSTGREYGNINCRILDFDLDTSIKIILNKIYIEIYSMQAEIEILYRDDKRYVKKLIKKIPSRSNNGTAIKQNGCYVIMGGFGGIGSILVEHLLKYYSANVLVIGRSPVNSVQVTQKLNRFSSLQGSIQYSQCDITEISQYQSIIQDYIDLHQQNTDGIFNLAGQAPVKTLAQETAETLMVVSDIKGKYAQGLSRFLTGNNFYIAFSSVTGFFGGATMSAYTASNISAEMLCHNLRQEGKKAWCLGPSTWEETGLSKGHTGAASTRAQGHYAMKPMEGLVSLLALLNDEPSLMYCGLDSYNPHVSPHVLFMKNKIQDIVTLRALIDMGNGERPVDLPNFSSIPFSIMEYKDVSGEKWKLSRDDALNILNGKKLNRELNDTEKKLQEIWKKILGFQTDIDVNFFEAGGTSLLALKLLSSIEEAFDRKFDQSMLFEASTIEALASIVDASGNKDDSTDTSSKVVLLRPSSGEHKGSIFFVHDADGNTLLYRELANNLNSGFSVYGLPPSTYGSLPSISYSIPHMAQWFADRILDTLSWGETIYLGGLCAGGALAVETAAELEERGCPVQKIMLFDSVNTTIVDNLRSQFEQEKRKERVAGTVNKKTLAVIPLLFKKALSYTSYKMNSRKAQKLKNKEFKQIRQNLETGRIPQNKFNYTWTIRSFYSMAKRGFQPRSVNADIILYKATHKQNTVPDGVDDTPACDYCFDPYFGWKNLSENIELIDIPGGHSSILQDPNVEKIYKSINDQLIKNSRESWGSISENSTAVVIVNYNTPQLSIDCLESISIERLIAPGIRVYLLDGGSTDNSCKIISEYLQSKKDWDWVKFKNLNVNKGFAFGCNAGIALALEDDPHTEYIHLLNPDTIVRKQGISKLIEYLNENPEAGLAASSLENRLGVRRPTRFRFPTLLNELNSAAKIKVITNLTKNKISTVPGIATVPCQVDWAPGASILFRKKILEEIGLLDDDFFLYYEETEWLYRAAQKSYPLFYIPDSRIVHLVGESTGVTKTENKQKRKPRYWYESRTMYFKKTKGSIYALVADFFCILGLLINTARNVYKPDSVKHNMSAIKDVIANSNFFVKKGRSSL